MKLASVVATAVTAAFYFAFSEMFGVSPSSASVVGVFAGVIVVGYLVNGVRREVERR